MENKNLKAEQDWVDKNPQYYQNAQHQEDVKHNIAVNYDIRELQNRINVLRGSYRHTDLKYVSIKCPPTPKLDEELKVPKQNWYDIVTGVVENKGIFDRVKFTGTRDHAGES